MSSPNEAYVAAELMALDIAVRAADRAIGTAVTTSDAHGRQLFAIPINLSLLVSAFGSEVSVPARLSLLPPAA